MHMKKLNGFSLIEIMVTIAIIAILMGVGVPSMMGMIAGNRLTTQTNDLVADISFARAEAIRRNQSVTFCRTATATSHTCADGTTWTHWIVTNNPAAGVDANTLRRGSLSSAASSELTLSSTFPSSRVVFRSNGLADGAGSLQLCSSRVSSENVRLLDVGGGGRVTNTKQSGTC